MSYFIDLEKSEIVVTPPGRVAQPGQVVIDGETAAACDLRNGQLLTAEQVQSLRDGSVDAYRATLANSGHVNPEAVPSAAVPAASFNAPVSGQQVGRAAYPSTTQAPTDAGTAAVVWTTIIAMLAWIVAGVSSIVQKHAADAAIKDSYDISAIQIQQLNGSVTAHVLVAMVVAMGLTVPLMIALLSRIAAD